MEAVFTITIMAFLGYAGVLALGLPKETLEGDALGAGGFPLATILLGLLLCALLLARQLRAKGGAGKLVDLGAPAGRAIVYTAIALAAYMGAMNLLGFVLSTLAFTAAAALIMGYRKPAKLALFAVLATAGLVLLFGKAFFVPLPRGAGFLKELSYLVY